jgi:hypothetical protein
VSPEVLDSFFSSARPTSLPYNEWLTGQRLLLVQGQDFTEEPRAVVTKVLAYAKRRDWAVIAVLARRRTDPPRGPARCIQIWGDPDRSYAEGPPDEILRELGRLQRGRRYVSN